MSAVERINFDCPCAECGYNMRSLRPGDCCPECRQPVVDGLNALRRRRGEDAMTCRRGMSARGERWFRIIISGGMINGVLLMLVLVVSALASPPGAGMNGTTIAWLSALCILPFPMYFGFYKLAQRFSRPKRRSTACGECGYDLRGSDSLRCPDCGAWRTLPACASEQ